MRRRPLGRSGLLVSELALGAMTFSIPGWGCDEATSVALVDRYLEAGGNLIDTADVYADSELYVGRALAGRRDDVVLATKVGLPTGPGPLDRGAGRAHVVRACERSLQRLGTDHIDLYWVHVDDESTPLEETVGALDDLVRQGKVRYVGASNFRAYRLMQALSISDQLGAARFVGFQGQYNLIVRTLEREHLALLEDQGVGLVSWSPLASGMLTGKVRPGVDDPDGSRLERRSGPTDRFKKNERGFEIAALVTALAAEVGCAPAQLALAWQRSRPVTSVILGVRTLDQLEGNLASLDVEVPADVLQRLDEATAPAPEYPWDFIDLIRSR